MAVLLQSGLCITVLISEVTYDCPALINDGGCSLDFPIWYYPRDGRQITLLGGGKEVGHTCTLPSCPSCLTVSKLGSGFQMPGTLAF